MWGQFTNLGDLSVMLPAAALIAIALLCAREWSRAAWWCGLFGGGGSAVALSKILFIGWGIGSRRFDFTGISGHTMLACSVIPVVFYLAASVFAPGGRLVALAAGLMCGAAIGYSRLQIHVHSVSEVVAGFVVGLVVSLLFANRPAARRGNRVGVIAIMVMLIAAMNMQYGIQAPGEDIVTRIALFLSGHEHPYVRGDWRG